MTTHDIGVLAKDDDQLGQTCKKPPPTHVPRKTAHFQEQPGADPSPPPNKKLRSVNDFPTAYDAKNRSRNPAALHGFRSHDHIEKCSGFVGDRPEKWFMHFFSVNGIAHGLLRQ